MKAEHSIVEYAPSIKGYTWRRPFRQRDSYNQGLTASFHLHSAGNSCFFVIYYIFCFFFWKGWERRWMLITYRLQISDFTETSGQRGATRWPGDRVWNIPAWSELHLHADPYCSLGRAPLYPKTPYKKWKRLKLQLFDTSMLSHPDLIWLAFCDAGTSTSPRYQESTRKAKAAVPLIHLVQIYVSCCSQLSTSAFL